MRLTSDPFDAARTLLAGNLAALPTETVYGLGARADDPHAIAKVYAAKGRPADHPLIAHLQSARVLEAWGRNIPEYAYVLADALWPGPLTLVVSRTERAADFITGGQDSVALRVSAHPFMQKVQRELARLADDEAIAIAAPSANRFGRVSPTTAAHVLAELQDYTSEDDVVLDGGPCIVGVESTIIDCTGDHPRLLRPGMVTAEQVEALTGLSCTRDSTVRASGTLDSHYSPMAAVELLSADELVGRVFEPGQARIGLLALSEIPTPPGIVRLSAPSTIEQFGQILYAALREADALRLSSVIVVAPPRTGLGEAIHDRLSRAAHPN